MKRTIFAIFLVVVLVFLFSYIKRQNDKKKIEKEFLKKTIALINQIEGLESFAGFKSVVEISYDEVLNFFKKNEPTPATKIYLKNCTEKNFDLVKRWVVSDLSFKQNIDPQIEQNLPSFFSCIMLILKYKEKNLSYILEGYSKSLYTLKYLVYKNSHLGKYEDIINQLTNIINDYYLLLDSYKSKNKETQSILSTIINESQEDVEKTKEYRKTQEELNKKIDKINSNINKRLLKLREIKAFYENHLKEI